MNKRFLEGKGITLVALVVTIIVLLILAGVTISMVLSSTGILGRAGQGREAQERATIEEQIELGKADADLGERSGENYFTTLSSYLAPNNGVLNSIATPVTVELNANSLVLRVGEKYVYQITREGASYLGSAEESSTLNVELKTGAITFTNDATLTDDGYTQGPVTVTITKSSDSEYDGLYIVYAYSAEAANWTRYTAPLSETANTTIYARLTNGIGTTAAYATDEISNIDTEAPTNVNFTIDEESVTANSITVTASAQDNNSSVKLYYSFSATKDGTESWSTKQTNATYKFENLDDGTSYAIKVKAIDVAGNSTTSASQTKSTESTISKDTGPMGEPINVGLYGQRVTNYVSKEGIVWRLFFEDSENIYLISETTDKGFPESRDINSNINNYSLGSRVLSSQGKDLLPLLSGVKSSSAGTVPIGTNESEKNLLENNYDRNMQATAFLCDTSDNGPWSEYVAGKASWAMGTPPVELYIASYNATHASGEKMTITIYGQGYQPGYPSLYETCPSKSEYNGIYNLRGTGSWWMAGPSYRTQELTCVYESDNWSAYITSTSMSYSRSLRPIVCLQKTNFTYVLEN